MDETHPILASQFLSSRPRTQAAVASSPGLREPGGWGAVVDDPHPMLNGLYLLDGECVESVACTAAGKSPVGDRKPAGFA